MRRVHYARFFADEDKENLKNGKVRFYLNIDFRKEKGDSWMNGLNAINVRTKFFFSTRPTGSD